MKAAVIMLKELFEHHKQKAAFWKVELCGFVKTDISEELIASIFRMERIRELETALAVSNTNNEDFCEIIINNNKIIIIKPKILPHPRRRHSS
jgi:hypothetical protein